MSPSSDDCVPWHVAEATFNLGRSEPLTRYPRPQDIESGSVRWTYGLQTKMEEAVFEHPITLLTGEPGTGKTFHALLLCARWEAAPKRLRFLGLVPRERHAYYGRAGATKAANVFRDWDEEAVQNSDSLWVIDEALQDPATCNQIVDRFRYLELGDRGHSLVLIDRSQTALLAGLHALWDQRPESVVPEVGRDTVVNALRLSGFDLQPDDDLLSEIERGGLGLREILYLADRRKLRLPLERDPYGFLKDYFRLLPDPSLKALAAQLARLRFLSLVLSDPRAELDADLGRLQASGLAVELGGQTGGWTIADDEAARALIELEYRDAGAGAAFYGPLVDLIKLHPRLAGPVARTLAERSVGELRTWARSPTGRTSSARCLEEALPVLLAALPWISEHQAISDAADTWRPLVRERAARDQVAELVRGRIRDLADALAEVDLRTWSAVRELSPLSPEIGINVRSVLADPAFAERAGRLSEDELIALSEHVRALDPVLANSLYRLKLPKSAAALATELRATSGPGFWNRLDSVAALDHDLACDTFRLTDPSQVAEVFYRDPHKASTVLSSLKERKQEAIDRLRESLQGTTVAAADIEAWPTARRVASFLVVAAWLGRLDLVEASIVQDAVAAVIRSERMSLVVDVCRAIRLWRDQSSLVRRVVRVLGERISRDSTVAPGCIHAMSLLDRRAAYPHKLNLLRAVASGERSSAGSGRDFWVLLDSSATLRQGNSELVRSATRSLLRAWKPAVPTPMNDVTFVGLTAYLLGIHAPHVESEWETRVNPEPPSAPIISACQLYAFATNPTSLAGRDERLRWLVRPYTEDVRLRAFARNWLILLGDVRRLVLDIVSSSVDALVDDPGTSSIGRDVAQAATGALTDWIWDEAPSLRLRLVARHVNRSEACELLARRVADWCDRLPLFGQTAVVQLALSAIAIEPDDASGKAAVQRLMDAAVDATLGAPISVTLAITELRDAALGREGPYASPLLGRSHPSPLIALLARAASQPLGYDPLIERAARGLPAHEAEWLRRMARTRWAKARSV